jgi:hypothetical protein
MEVRYGIQLANKILTGQRGNVIEKDKIFWGNALGKSCSHDPDKFKTGFESSLSLPVKKKEFFSRPAITLFVRCTVLLYLLLLPS